MGACESKNGVEGVFTGQTTGGKPAAMTAEQCWQGGGWRWDQHNNGNWQFNPNFPCDSMARCDGTPSGVTAIGGKTCGKDNIEYICVSAPNGGEWKPSPYECDAGSAGMCPTSCGEITLCDGRKVATSKIGAKVCGEKDGKYVNFTCDKDGTWHAADDCKCMTICPDLKGCSGMLTKQKVGAEVCGDDRKMHICMANLNAPPEWTYGKKCGCPGDPPEPTPAVVAPASPSLPTVAAGTAVAATSTASSNTTLIAVGGLLFLFFIIIIVVAIMLARRKRAGGTGVPLPADGYPMGNIVDDRIPVKK